MHIVDVVIIKLNNFGNVGHIDHNNVGVQRSQSN
jgi:hypothetical protein